MWGPRLVFGFPGVIYGRGFVVRRSPDSVGRPLALSTDRRCLERYLDTSNATTPRWPGYQSGGNVKADLEVV